MSIDKIMGQVQAFARDWKRAWGPSGGGESGTDLETQAQNLRTLIASAIADAKREGAEQMREAIAQQAEINALYGVHGTTVSTIRAMPLPDDSRAHGERHGTATPGQRAAQLAAIDEFTAAKDRK